MTERNPPTQYFTGIIYNSQFWVDTSNSTLYLGRIGTPNSVATNTTFNGTLTTNGISNTGTITTTDLTVTNVIQGTALNANNVYSQNNNANATHYITYTDNSTNGYGVLQKHATFTFNPNTETFTTLNIVATTSMTSVTPVGAENSTIVATTAWVKSFNYAKTDTYNFWTNDNYYNVYLPSSTLTTFTNVGSNYVFVTRYFTDTLYPQTAHTWSGTQTFTGIAYFNAPVDSNSISIGGGLRNLTTSNLYNTCVGNSLNALTSGNSNLALGSGVLPLITTNSENIGIGYRSLEKLTAGGGNTNIGIGFISGYSLTSGNYNSFFSTASGAGLGSGSENFCMGFQTIATYATPQTANSTNVQRNLALGTYALLVGADNIADNVAIGYRALANEYGNYSMKSSKNVAIGSLAGYGLAGTNCDMNVFVGYNTSVVSGTTLSNVSTTTYTNITAINTQTISSPASNSVYIGNSSVTNTYLKGTVNVSNITQNAVQNINTSTFTGTSSPYTVPAVMPSSVLCQFTGDGTINLPALTSSYIGFKLLVRKIGTLAITLTITPNGTNTTMPVSSTTASASSITLSTTQACVEFIVTSATNWAVLYIN